MDAAKSGYEIDFAPHRDPSQATANEWMQWLRIVFDTLSAVLDYEELAEPAPRLNSCAMML